jgi:hypothetical protein
MDQNLVILDKWLKKLFPYFQGVCNDMDLFQHLTSRSNKQIVFFFFLFV